jgi:superfamily II DNA/RNA helicase
LFSATLLKEPQGLIAEQLHQPLFRYMAPQATVSTLRQQYIFMPSQVTTLLLPYASSASRNSLSLSLSRLLNRRFRATPFPHPFLVISHCLFSTLSFLHPVQTRHCYFVNLIQSLEAEASKIVFTSTCRSCEELSVMLRELEVPNVSLHSQVRAEASGTERGTVSGCVSAAALP